jgi:hypothetical protein
MKNYHKKQLRKRPDQINTKTTVIIKDGKFYDGHAYNPNLVVIRKGQNEN